MLKIHLFGSGSADNGSGLLAGFPGQQAGLLLCYIILNGSQPISRERLAAVFWEDYPTATARKYLRNTLWRLKHMLEDAGADSATVLQITEDHISLNLDGLWVDILQFEEALANTQKHKPEALSRLQVAELEAAAALYTGDLLDNTYEDWTLYDRERLRLAYLTIRQKLMLHHGRFGRYDSALFHGEKILAIDPVREKIHRYMMRLHALNGDRSAALAQYKRCKQILKEELNLPPLKETRLLYKQLKDELYTGEMPDASADEISFPNVLNRLQKLQRLANRLHNELRSLEKLLHQNLLDADS